LDGLITGSFLLYTVYIGERTIALTGFPKRDLDRLQSGINAAAHLTTGALRYDHIMPLLKDLHWLRVPERHTAQCD